MNIIIAFVEGGTERVDLINKIVNGCNYSIFLKIGK